MLTGELGHGSRRRITVAVYQRDNEAYYGQLSKGFESSGRRWRPQNGTPDTKQAQARCLRGGGGLREALFGKRRRRKRAAANAVKGIKRKGRAIVARALAPMVGDKEKAQSLPDSLKSRFPDDTIVKLTT